MILPFSTTPHWDDQENIDNHTGTQKNREIQSTETESITRTDFHVTISSQNLFSQGFQICPIRFSERFYQQPDQKFLLRWQIPWSQQQILFKRDTGNSDSVAPTPYPIAFWERGQLRFWGIHSVASECRQRECRQVSVFTLSTRREVTLISVKISNKSVSYRAKTPISIEFSPDGTGFPALEPDWQAGTRRACLEPDQYPTSSQETQREKNARTAEGRSKRMSSSLSSSFWSYSSQFDKDIADFQHDSSILNNTTLRRPRKHRQSHRNTEKQRDSINRDREHHQNRLPCHYQLTEFIFTRISNMSHQILRTILSATRSEIFTAMTNSLITAADFLLFKRDTGNSDSVAPTPYPIAFWERGQLRFWGIHSVASECRQRECRQVSVFTLSTRREVTLISVKISNKSVSYRAKTPISIEFSPDGTGFPALEPDWQAGTRRACLEPDQYPTSSQETQREKNARTAEGRSKRMSSSLSSSFWSYSSQFDKDIADFQHDSSILNNTTLRRPRKHRQSHRNTEKQRDSINRDREHHQNRLPCHYQLTEFIFTRISNMSHQILRTILSATRSEIFTAMTNSLITAADFLLFKRDTGNSDSVAPTPYPIAFWERGQLRFWGIHSVASECRQRECRQVSVFTLSTRREVTLISVKISNKSVSYRAKTPISIEFSPDGTGFPALEPDWQAGTRRACLEPDQYPTSSQETQREKNARTAEGRSKRMSSSLSSSFWSYSSQFDKDIADFQHDSSILNNTTLRRPRKHRQSHRNTEKQRDSINRDREHHQNRLPCHYQLTEFIFTRISNMSHQILRTILSATRSEIFTAMTNSLITAADFLLFKRDTGNSDSVAPTPYPIAFWERGQLRFWGIHSVASECRQRECRQVSVFTLSTRREVTLISVKISNKSVSYRAKTPISIEFSPDGTGFPALEPDWQAGTRRACLEPDQYPTSSQETQREKNARTAEGRSKRMSSSLSSSFWSYSSQFDKDIADFQHDSSILNNTTLRRPRKHRQSHRNTEKQRDSINRDREHHQNRLPCHYQLTEFIFTRISNMSHQILRTILSATRSEIFTAMTNSLITAADFLLFKRDTGNSDSVAPTPYPIAFWERGQLRFWGIHSVASECRQRECRQVSVFTLSTRREVTLISVKISNKSVSYRAKTPISIEFSPDGTGFPALEPDWQAGTRRACLEPDQYPTSSQETQREKNARTAEGRSKRMSSSLSSSFWSYSSQFDKDIADFQHDSSILNNTTLRRPRKHRQSHRNTEKQRDSINRDREHHQNRLPCHYQLTEFIFTRISNMSHQILRTILSATRSEIFTAMTNSLITAADFLLFKRDILLFKRDTGNSDSVAPTPYPIAFWERGQLRFWGIHSVASECRQRECRQVSVFTLSTRREVTLISVKISNKSVSYRAKTPISIEFSPDGTGFPALEPDWQAGTRRACLEPDQYPTSSQETQREKNARTAEGRSKRMSSSLSSSFWSYSSQFDKDIADFQHDSSILNNTTLRRPRKHRQSHRNTEKQRDSINRDREHHQNRLPCHYQLTEFIFTRISNMSHQILRTILSATRSEIFTAMTNSLITAADFLLFKRDTGNSDSVAPTPYPIAFWERGQLRFWGIHSVASECRQRECRQVSVFTLSTRREVTLISVKISNKSVSYRAKTPISIEFSPDGTGFPALEPDWQAGTRRACLEPDQYPTSSQETQREKNARTAEGRSKRMSSSLSSSFWSYSSQFDKDIADFQHDSSILNNTTLRRPRKHRQSHRNTEKQRDSINRDREHHQNRLPCHYQLTEFIFTRISNMSHQILRTILSATRSEIFTAMTNSLITAADFLLFKRDTGNSDSVAPTPYPIAFWERGQLRFWGIHSVASECRQRECRQVSVFTLSTRREVTLISVKISNKSVSYRAKTPISIEFSPDGTGFPALEPDWQAGTRRACLEPDQYPTSSQETQREKNARTAEGRSKRMSSSLSSSFWSYSSQFDKDIADFQHDSSILNNTTLRRPRKHRQSHRNTEKQRDSINRDREHHQNRLPCHYQLTEFIFTRISNMSHQILRTILSATRSEIFTAMTNSLITAADFLLFKRDTGNSDSVAPTPYPIAFWERGQLRFWGIHSVASECRQRECRQVSVFTLSTRREVTLISVKISNKSVSYRAKTPISIEFSPDGTGFPALEPDWQAGTRRACLEPDQYPTSSQETQREKNARTAEGRSKRMSSSLSSSFWSYSSQFDKDIADFQHDSSILNNTTLRRPRKHRQSHRNTEKQRDSINRDREHHQNRLPCHYQLTEFIFTRISNMSHQILRTILSATRSEIFTAMTNSLITAADFLLFKTFRHGEFRFRGTHTIPYSLLRTRAVKILRHPQCSKRMQTERMSSGFCLHPQH